MSLRRVNHHQTGFSNIDFRTNQDKAALKLFQPWMVPPDYGTMGHANCSALPDIRRKVMKNSKSLCSLYEFEKGIPNSKTYNTCEFYSRNKIVPKFKTILNNGKRYANLDESKIGKEIYNGDSMMIAENRKKRAEIIRRKKLRKTTSSVFDRMEMSTKEKMKRMFDDTIHLNEEENKKEENKEISSDEIDNSKKTPLEEDNYVDLENIQKIRNVFKEKYKNRNNYFSIYKDYNVSNQGCITDDDLCKMVEALGFKMNKNEANVLISSLITNKKNSLGYIDFIDLLLGPKSRNEIPSEYKGEKIIKNQEDLESFQKKLKNNCGETKVNDSLFGFEQLMKTRMQAIFFQLQQRNYTNIISKENFTKMLRDIKFPERYFDEGIADKFYKKFESEKDNNSIDFAKYLNSFYEEAEKGQNEFFAFQNYSLAKTKNKIEKGQLSLEEYRKILKETLSKIPDEYNRYLFYKSKLNNPIQLSEKERLQNLNESANFNIYQPSKEFVMKIFGKGKEYKEKRDLIEKQFSSRPIDLLTTEKFKQGENQIYGHDTRVFFEPNPKSDLFMNNQERFKVKSLNDRMDFVKKEKEMKRTRSEAAQNRRRNWEELRQNEVSFRDSLEDLRNKASEIKKAKLFYDIESKNQDRNFFIE